MKVEVTQLYPGQNTGVGSRSLLQGIFPTQGLNPGLPHYRQILLPAELPGKPQGLFYHAVKGRLTEVK